jgi:hypothetical protein
VMTETEECPPDLEREKVSIPDFVIPVDTRQRTDDTHVQRGPAEAPSKAKTKAKNLLKQRLRS